MKNICLGYWSYLINLMNIEKGINEQSQYHSMCKKFSFFCTLVLLSRLSSNALNFDMYFFMIKWQVLVCNYSISECTKILNWMIKFILCRYKNEFGRGGPFSWLGATYKPFYYEVCMKRFSLYKFLSFVSFGI